MKFGKEFQQILDQSDFPDEWKSSAIEYRRVSCVGLVRGSRMADGKVGKGGQSRWMYLRGTRKDTLHAVH